MRFFFLFTDIKTNYRTPFPGHSFFSPPPSRCGFLAFIRYNRSVFFPFFSSYMNYFLKNGNAGPNNTIIFFENVFYYNLIGNRLFFKLTVFLINLKKSILNVGIGGRETIQINSEPGIIINRFPGPPISF